MTRLRALLRRAEPMLPWLEDAMAMVACMWVAWALLVVAGVMEPRP